MLTLVACLLLAFLAQEPIEIAMAALFCFVSSMAASILTGISGRHFYRLMLDAIRAKNLRVMTRRYRWVPLDATIGLLLVLGFAVSNYVIENSVGNARHLVIYCWSIGPIIVLVVWVCLARFGRNQTQVIADGDD